MNYGERARVKEPIHVSTVTGRGMVAGKPSTHEFWVFPATNLPPDINRMPRTNRMPTMGYWVSYYELSCVVLRKNAYGRWGWITTAANKYDGYGKALAVTFNRNTSNGTQSWSGRNLYYPRKIQVHTMRSPSVHKVAPLAALPGIRNLLANMVEEKDPAKLKKLVEEAKEIHAMLDVIPDVMAGAISDLYALND